MPVEQIAGEYNATPKTMGDGQPTMVQTDNQGRLLVAPSGSAPVGGGITWGAPTAVAVTAGPASTTLIAANAARKALLIWNPVGNAQMSINIAGGAAVLATGIPLLGGAFFSLSGAECPVGAVTFIGTAGQSLVYQEGT